MQLDTTLSVIEEDFTIRCGIYNEEKRWFTEKGQIINVTGQMHRRP